MVTCDAAVALAHRLAREEADRRGLAEDDWKRDSLVDVADEIAKDLFWWIERTGERDTIGKRIASWSHRSAVDLETDWRTLVIDRALLRGAAEKYLDNGWLASREMDWYVVNTLTYAEVLGTLDQVRLHSWPMWRYVWSKSSPASDQWKVALAGGLVWTVKWTIWVVALLAGLIFIPLLAAALVAVTLLVQAMRFHARRKVAALLHSMLNTYASMASVSNSWAVVWEELARSRAAGVVWDGVVYRLVEDRLHSRAAPESPASHQLKASQTGVPPN